MRWEFLSNVFFFWRFVSYSLTQTVRPTGAVQCTLRGAPKHFRYKQCRKKEGKNRRKWITNRECLLHCCTVGPIDCVELRMLSGLHYFKSSWQWKVKILKTIKRSLSSIKLYLLLRLNFTRTNLISFVGRPCFCPNSFTRNYVLIKISSVVNYILYLLINKELFKWFINRISYTMWSKTCLLVVVDLDWWSINWINVFQKLCLWKDFAHCAPCGVRMCDDDVWIQHVGAVFRPKHIGRPIGLQGG